MEYIWLILAIILVVVEISVPTLVSVWFAISAAVVFLIALYIESILIEILIFVILSVILLILTKPFVEKVMQNKGKIESRIYGKKVKIEKEAEHGKYEVYLDGKYWYAISDEELKVGDSAIVEKIEGNKLIIKREE